MSQQATGNLTTERGIFTVRTPDYREPRPFHLGMLGFKSNIRSTGCYDGFVASYAMWEGRLFLAELCVLVDRREELPDICGIFPEVRERGEDPTYRGLRLPLGYTGYLWLEPREEFTVWIPIRERTRISYRVSFCGGLLRAAEKFVYNPQEHYAAVMHPRDFALDELPPPDVSTPFDDQLIPLSEYERERIEREYTLEYKRHLPRESKPLFLD